MSRRRRRTRAGRSAIAGAALVLAATGAATAAVSTGLVKIERPARQAAAAPLADTSAGVLVVPAPSTVPALPDIPLPPIAPDSAAAADAAVMARPADSLAARSAEATPAELGALAARLVVPVAGVGREQLVDSFDDARGDRGADSAGTRRHDALDILAPRGTPVVAATGGRVLKLFDSRLGGLTVYAADESERFILLYAHLDRYAPGLREGARLRQGETLGYVGTTGNANPATPHLHFAIARATEAGRWWEGTAVNPYPLLRGR